LLRIEPNWLAPCSDPSALDANVHGSDARFSPIRALLSHSCATPMNGALRWGRRVKQGQALILEKRLTGRASGEIGAHGVDPFLGQ
jgi:hypothetical protein